MTDDDATVDTDSISTRAARWIKQRAQDRADAKALKTRGTVIPPQPNTYRGAQLHDCPHSKKHHKASGRCRRGCDCTWGGDKAARKDKANEG